MSAHADAERGLDPSAYDDTIVFDPEIWADGPPLELFRELRHGCPVHFSKRIPDFPEEAGFWSITTARTRPSAAASPR